MIALTFVIQGNPDDDDGNPLGYKRMLKQHMREDARRYLEWLKHVREAFEDAYPDVFMTDDKWPLTTSKTSHARMNVDIEFANDGHRADCDNVYKGIADALFQNDKYLMEGHYKGVISPDQKGRVYVTINFEE